MGLWSMLYLCAFATLRLYFPNLQYIFQLWLRRTLERHIFAHQFLCLQTARQNLKVQKIIAFISIGLFAVKITAWVLTNSVAILTDALESIVNIAAGLFGVYSLFVSAKPKDIDHPYGHGKINLFQRL